MTTDTPDPEPSTPVVEHRRDANVHLGTTVAFAVSEATGVTVTELDLVLNDYVDPDALHALFAPKEDGTPRSKGSVTFTAGDCEVTVHGDRRVVATPIDTTRPDGAGRPDRPDRPVHADRTGGDGSAPA